MPDHPPTPTPWLSGGQLPPRPDHGPTHLIRDVTGWPVGACFKAADVDQIVTAVNAHRVLMTACRAVIDYCDHDPGLVTVGHALIPTDLVDAIRSALASAVPG